MSTVKNYFSLVKFSHTIFALPFALVGFALGVKHFEAIRLLHPFNDFPNYTFIFIAVLICMVSARNAAMAFNRLLDRKFDAANNRTKNREIPMGKISAQQALIFVCLNCLIFIVTTFFINAICLLLSPVALFIILFYSYTKRFTALCHLVLGLGLSLAPIGAYLALTGMFDAKALMLSLFVLGWVSGFDIIYALQDEEFDKSYKLHSIPSLLGKPRALLVSRIIHTTCILILLAYAFMFKMHLLYWIGAGIFIVMILYQQSIVKHNDLSKVNIAFMTANGIASVVFGLFMIAELYFY